MKIEHFALNVPDPVAMADWYCQHLGFSIKRKTDGAPFARFLFESQGTVMLEIYNNPEVDPPDYHAINPLTLHLAFQCRDVEETLARLIKAGARAEGDILRPDNGDVIAMLRDPWGFCIQFVHRGDPMLREAADISG